jgi:hypothetical protein
MAIFTDAVKLLQSRRQGLVAEIDKIDAAARALGSIRTGGATVRRKPQFTKAGLARIAAQRNGRGGRS